ncbi:MAG: hypothetical protein VX278_19780 [Myxococcota bacterium]|nr:hypothetical protein [Myxococcota bacterium]
MKPQGLTKLRTDELKKLLRLLYREEVETPLSPKRIACIGFQYRQEELMNALRDLDARAMQAVIVAVLAERLK